MNIYDTREGARLLMNRQQKGHWNRWGPFLAKRAWGTVCEDYSTNGHAWGHFPHDHVRSRAYRWKKDGLAGICDRHQYLCFALALWNGRDPILKKRLFGLTEVEGTLMTLDQVAEELARRLARIFLLDGEGRRPVFGSCELFNADPRWRDLIPFYEYFHGDSGRGCGASHQTGWTGLIAQSLITFGAGLPAVNPPADPL